MKGKECKSSFVGTDEKIIRVQQEYTVASLYITSVTYTVKKLLLNAGSRINAGSQINTGVF